MLNKDQFCTAATARELDRIAIEDFGIPGFTLMQRAAAAAFEALISRWPATRKLLVCCGSGNNGGDGLLMAVLAVKRGLQAEVYINGAASSTSDAGKARASAESADIPIFPLEQLGKYTAGAHTVVVDALLGTGLKGAVKAPFQEAIAWINHSGLPVCAVDIPSGLCSDTGQVLGICVHAQLTVTFIAPKLGLVMAAGPQHAGELVLDQLDLPDAVYARLA